MIFRRFFAFLIDKIIIIIITGILGFLIGLVIGAFVQEAKQEYFENAFIIICFLSIPFYYSYFESSEMQGTLGKKLLNIKIVDTYSEDTLDGATAFLRFIAYFFINITIIGSLVSIIMMIFREDEKMLHDIFLNTKVVRR
ncbi:MAG: RDD family protein [Rickettsia endosymbiont of Argas persicus]